MAKSQLEPNTEFSYLASQERIARTAEALTANGIQTFVVVDADEARKKVFELIPQGAEVFNATSQTIDQIGVAAEIESSGRYEVVRNRLVEFDQEGQERAKRQLGAAPDVLVASVHAITEQGQLLIASMSGSQLGAGVSGAAKVIYVVGVQKLVANLNDGFRRLYEYTLPLEDERALNAYGVNSAVNKLLIINREIFPGRISVVLVNENLGF
ncbi:membrane protein [Dictyobacter alpinus]|uniref:Membrane protein n=1 Tax=Dictyobacter alpinus TaxID=2014873 RepID=A0A402BEY1_9CHLR|nr:LUD domain-containing protein [Dictyobacter alpinus]GCE29889.1 membrane protein [Dictyobacter alpinus]